MGQRAEPAALVEEGGRRPGSVGTGRRRKSRLLRQEGVDDLVVFLGLARAGGIDEPAAGPDDRRGLVQQPPLRLGQPARSASVRRHLTSGSRRMMPRPEQGASSRTASKMRPKGSGARRPPARCGPLRAPEAATVRASRSTRRPRTSVATISPLSPIAAAIAVVLPPGEAQASRIRSPAAGPTNGGDQLRGLVLDEERAVVGERRQQRIAASTTSASGAKRPGSVPTPCTVERRDQRVRASCAGG